MPTKIGSEIGEVSEFSFPFSFQFFNCSGSVFAEETGEFKLFFQIG